MLIATGHRAPTATQIREQTRHNAMAHYGTGSTLQQSIQAATAVIQGLAGGGYVSRPRQERPRPTWQKLLKKARRMMAHAVVAQASSNSALAGAAGAVSGELDVSVIKEQLYGETTQTSEFNEE